METGIIIAGSGGQGILYLGKTIALAAMMDGKHVTWFPSYGAEMRGGAARCTVIISDDLIGSPVVLHPDVLIAMNTISIERYQKLLKKNGLLFYDSSTGNPAYIRKDVRYIAIPATMISNTSGSTKSANMVMLGAFIAYTGILKIEDDFFKKVYKYEKKTNNDISKINFKSFLKGIEYIEDQKTIDS